MHLFEMFGVCAAFAVVSAEEVELVVKPLGPD